MHNELTYREEGFRDGRYSGECFVNATAQSHILELELTFKSGEIAGAVAGGSKAAVKGTYNDKPPFDFQIRVEADGLQMDGNRGPSGKLTGRWKNVKVGMDTQKGLFELMVYAPAGDAAEEIDVTEDPNNVITSLVAMGFDPAKCDLAVNQHQLGLYEAIDWISSGCPELPEDVMITGASVGGGSGGAGARLPQETPESIAEKVKQICEMGFDETQAKQALQRSHNNVDHAIALLCGE